MQLNLGNIYWAHYLYCLPQEHIRKKMEKETMTGVAVAGGAALVLGGLVGLGFALAKK